MTYKIFVHLFNCGFCFSAWDRVVMQFNRLTSKNLEKRQLQKKYSDTKYKQKGCVINKGYIIVY